MDTKFNIICAINLLRIVLHKVQNILEGAINVALIISCFLIIYAFLKLRIAWNIIQPANAWNVRNIKVLNKINAIRQFLNVNPNMKIISDNAECVIKNKNWKIIYAIK